MSDKIYIEVNAEVRNHYESRICGDTFLMRRIPGEERIIVVLSDGMGHGVKAAMLSTLTATMALNFTIEHKEFQKIAELIMNTLPVCSERKMSYATFSIIDIEIDGPVHILEYDNPQAFLIRKGKQHELEWTDIELEGEKNRGKKLRTCSFLPIAEDRVVICSDGVSQSGLGMKYPFGWGTDNISEYVRNAIKQKSDISALSLARKIVNVAQSNDGYQSRDDTSCAVIYFRVPRKLIICTGPPFAEGSDAEFARKLIEFDGPKVICGATTSSIISRELNRPIEDSFEMEDPDLPPTSSMEGVTLITEGILTLGKVTQILKNYTNNTVLGRGPADKIVKLLLEHDEIHFLVGTAINIAHQDPSLPVELEIRRTVIGRIARILEEKFLKQTHTEYT